LLILHLAQDNRLIWSRQFIENLGAIRGVQVLQYADSLDNFACIQQAADLAKNILNFDGIDHFISSFPAARLIGKSGGAGLAGFGKPGGSLSFWTQAGQQKTDHFWSAV